jgi:hypothetical protein
MAVLGLSLITNKCVAPGDTTVPPTHEEVLSVTDARAHDVAALVAAVVGRLELAHFPVPIAAAAFAGAAAHAAGGGAAPPAANPAASLPALGVATPWPDAAAAAVTPTSGSGSSGGGGSGCPYLRSGGGTGAGTPAAVACSGGGYHHGSGPRCPYTALTSALRCPPIAFVLGAAAAVGVMLALHAARCGGGGRSGGDGGIPGVCTPRKV